MPRLGKNPPENLLYGGECAANTPQGGTLFSPCALRGIRTFRQIVFLQKNKKTICKVLKGDVRDVNTFLIAVVKHH
jgi:hypothetical protein